MSHVISVIGLPILIMNTEKPDTKNGITVKTLINMLLKTKYGER